jgi:LPS sulfotransferase NodH
LLEIDYPTLVRDPVAGALRIAEFLGDERVPQRQAMPNVVKPQLHRQRSA